MTQLVCTDLSAHTRWCILKSLAMTKIYHIIIKKAIKKWGALSSPFFIPLYIFLMLSAKVERDHRGCDNHHIVGGMAFLVRDGKPTRAYQCTAIYLCDDTGSTYLYNGKSIRAAKGDIICGSCATDKPHDKVYIAYYDYVGEWDEP